MRLSLNRIAPAPEYLTLPSAGLDISDRSIRFIELRRRGNRITVGKFAESAIPEGLVARGKIVDRAGFARALGKFCASHGLSFVRASLPEEQTYLFPVRIPKVPARQVRGTIELSLEEHIPMPPEAAIFDYELIREDASSYELHVSALEAALAEDYAGALADAGAAPVSLELESAAIARAIVPRGDAGTYLVLDYGNTRTGISFVQEGVVRLASSLEIGGAAQAAEIATALGIAPDAAAERIRKHGLRKSGDAELFELLLAKVSLVRDEINRHYIFWHTRPDDLGQPRPPVSAVLLVGGSANMPGLVEYLSATLKLPVRHGDVWTNVLDRMAHVPELPRSQALSYATAIGLALGGIDSHD